MGLQRAQAEHHADLKAQEGDQLGQDHDVGFVPARVEQGLQACGAGVARMEDQQMGLLEGGRELVAQLGAQAAVQ